MTPRTRATSALNELAAEAAHCTRCELYRYATQVVFGEGPVGASLMFVGEQPGDKEDISGHPFVGPAGHIFDQALAQSGINRSDVYVTNAVKHFKHEQRGKRRLHKSPNRGEVQACRWWLDRELTLIKPRLLVALGVTAAHELLGKPVVLSRSRGQVLSFSGHRLTMTMHPSAILRLKNEADRQSAFDSFVADIRFAAQAVATA